MRIEIHITIKSDDGQIQEQEQIACLQRGMLTPEELGMNLAEAKELTHNVQEAMLRCQTAEFVRQQSVCPHCGKKRALKGNHEIVYRTLFGKLKVKSPRLYQCPCRAGVKCTASPLATLLPERTAPELLYLESKWASLMPFEETRGLLKEVLPVGDDLNCQSIRQNLQRVAERLEEELGQERQMFFDEAPPNPPAPQAPLTVGLDGGYLHNYERKSRQDGWFEVIVGKSVPADRPAKRFAFVRSYDDKPKRRLFEVLKSQGMNPNQLVTFLSDGGETVRNLPAYLNPQAEHLLDWFHITMRLTVMGQTAKGMSGVEAPSLVSHVESELESLKWHLWNGNVRPALEIVEGLKVLLAGNDLAEARAKLLKALKEFGRYIAANQNCIPDYGDRFRNDETITTAFVESAVNQIVSHRMVKQMRWSQRGAHLLLQVRTRVLNHELRETFCRWHPKMKAASIEPGKVAA